MGGSGKRVKRRRRYGIAEVVNNRTVVGIRISGVGTPNQHAEYLLRCGDGHETWKRSSESSARCGACIKRQPVPPVPREWTAVTLDKELPVRLGDACGRWTVEALASDAPKIGRKPNVRVFARCGCGRDAWMSVREFKRDEPCRCEGGQLGGRRTNEPAWGAADIVPVGMDPTFSALMEAKPDEWTFDEIGTAFGVSRERVRQIEREAMEKLRVACEEHGITQQEVIDMLASAANRDVDNTPDHEWGAGIGIGNDRKRAAKRKQPKGQGWKPKLWDWVGDRRIIDFTTRQTSSGKNVRWVVLQCPTCKTTAQALPADIRRGRNGQCKRCMTRRRRENGGEAFTARGAQLRLEWRRSA